MKIFAFVLLKLYGENLHGEQKQAWYFHNKRENNLVTLNLVILKTFKFVKHLLVEFLPKEQSLKSTQ